MHVPFIIFSVGGGGGTTTNTSITRKTPAPTPSGRNIGHPHCRERTETPGCRHFFSSFFCLSSPFLLTITPRHTSTTETKHNTPPHPPSTRPPPLRIPPQVRVNKRRTVYNNNKPTKGAKLVWRVRPASPAPHPPTPPHRSPPRTVCARAPLSSNTMATDKQQDIFHTTTHRCTVVRRGSTLFPPSRVAPTATTTTTTTAAPSSPSTTTAHSAQHNAKQLNPRFVLADRFEQTVCYLRAG